MMLSRVSVRCWRGRRFHGHAFFRHGDNWLTNGVGITTRWFSWRSGGENGKSTIASDALIVPFRLTVDDARNAFIKWQNRHWFAPVNVLSENFYIRPVMLPFWSVILHAEVSTTKFGQDLGNTGNTNQSSTDISWSKPILRKYDRLSPELLVFASYGLRRDYAQAMIRNLEPSILGAFSNSFSRDGHIISEVNKLKSSSEGICVFDVELKRSIAFELVQSQMRRAETNTVMDSSIEKEKGSDSFKDIAIAIRPLHRSMKLIYIPAFLVEYSYGKGPNVHGEREVMSYHGLVSGLAKDVVIGERHVSLTKVTTSAGSAAAAIMTALGLSDSSLSLFDVAFSSASVGSLAAMFTQYFPGIMASKCEEHIVSREQGTVSMMAAVSESKPPLDVDIGESIRSDLEWLRWEESNKLVWNPEKRRAWAESLFHSQILRRKKKRRAREEARLRYEKWVHANMRDQKRRMRWGSDSNRKNNSLPWEKQSDYLGYYQVLGLDIAARQNLQQEDIKRAFRRAAMEWHPDLHHKRGDKQALERFRLIQNAYAVLRDPDQRRQYDCGNMKRSD